MTKPENVAHDNHVDMDYPAIVASWSPDERKDREKKFLKKIDLRLLPILCWMYVMNYIDRNALPQARIQGIEADLGLTGYEYNIVLSVTFAGYISMQVPSNMILSYVRPSWYLSGCMVAWGIVSGLSGAVQNFKGLAVCRFCLGVTEAPFFVGVAFLFSGWYTRREIGLRLAIFFSAAMLSGAFGGLFAAGIEAAFKNNKLESWRWLFIIEGIVTVVCAIITGLVIPDWPATTKWLSQEEKALAVTRLLEDAGTDEEEITPKLAFKMAVTDYKVWLCILGQVCIQAVASVSNFLPTLVQDFGYGKIETLLLTAPPYVLTAIACIANSWFSDRLSLRSPFIVGPCLVTITGVIITLATTNIAARYFAIFLTLPASYACFQISNAWMTNIASRPRQKRAIALALNTAFGNSAMTWTPYLYPKSEGPRYVKAWSVNLAVTVVSLFIALFMRWVLARENKRLAESEPELHTSADGELKNMGIAETHENANETVLIRRKARYQI